MNNQNVYRNKTELTNLHGQPIYMNDVVEACLLGRLNLFLQGDTGSGKTQLAKDAMTQFGDKSLFILGRNDMDTRELFHQINPEFIRALKEGKLEKGVSPKELTDKINYHLTVVDELPNCVPAVRAQLFNLFDGFIEINGRAYPIGNGYSVGIATGNVGQKFTESANELGRALKDRMHVVIDTDYFFPKPSDTLEILSESTNPRVEFTSSPEDNSESVIERSSRLVSQDTSLDKYLVANYLLHGLDYCSKGSKRKMKEKWPAQLENHEQGSDVGLVLPVSPRAAKSILRLSQSLDEIARGKGASEETIEANAFDSVMQAYKFVSAYSGVLNEQAVNANYEGDKYRALDAIIAATRTQFDDQVGNIRAGLEMVKSGKTNQKVLNLFKDRWGFMKDTLGGLAEHYGNKKS
ncbi:AAA family ATPase [Candidatus Pacearchaeota archaeon]|nr:AAA family ATPase [Candidatus Pacearchaeota archaeon]